MANRPDAPRLKRKIRRTLSGLRWRIRGYVVAEGLAVAVIWICLTFWAGIALDYIPVLLGADEMPRAARAILLGVIAIVFGVILYRWILRRAFVHMADRSMAILLERRYRHFRDSLITSVELTDARSDADEFNEAMLSETDDNALRNLNQIRLSNVFDARPLLFSMAGALLLAATIGGAIAADQHYNANLLELGFRRLYLLDNDPWPRSAAIQVVGIQVQRELSDDSMDSEGAMMPFEDNRLKVARGANVSLFVRADAGAKVVPNVCSIYYTTAEGDRGRVNMTRVGRIRDGFQNYRYDGKPLKGILGDVSFDVVGFDHRVKDFKVEVVDSPVVVDASLACKFPDYMVNESLSTWLPRTISLTTATQLPLGTTFTLRARTNKQLADVVLRDTESTETLLARVIGDEFEFDVENLAANLSLEVTLLDTDNVPSERPYRIYIVGVEDQPPTVNVRLSGIGTAITPDALVTVTGTIEDDYEIASSAFEIMANDGDPQTKAFDLAAGGKVDASIDFREQRSQADGIKLEADSRLSLTVVATDKYNLGVEPNVGTGDHYQLEVVTPDKLLSLLEARELGLRRRFEQIRDEMNALRQSLVRVKTEGPETATANVEAADTTTDAEISEADAERNAIERIWSLRELRTQRAQLQSEKSTHETLGVAAAFGDIRAELINNRVDTEDRKQRLQEQVIDPLQSIGETLFPELDAALLPLAKRLDVRTKVEDEETVALATTAIDRTDDILLAMDEVLQSMLDIEDFNELLERVRDLITEQEGLIENTKKAQKQQVLDLLN